jgi:hypothetical protein
MANLKPCNFIVIEGGKERSLTYDEMRQYLFDNPKVWADVSTRRKVGAGKAIESQLSPAQQVADLRAKEQAEYDAMPDPKDKAKREEIYDKYDKLISPLLAQEGKKGQARSISAPISDNFKETIAERLGKFEERINAKKFPLILEVAEAVLPKDIFKKYQNLFELAARNAITVNNTAPPFNAVASYMGGSVQLHIPTLKRYIENYEELAETLGHEVIHGLIQYGIRDKYALFNDLQGVVENVINKFDSANEEVQNIINYIVDVREGYDIKDLIGGRDEKTGLYKEIGDLEELITYAFTNAEFAKFLQSIPASKEINASGKTIFDQLKDIIRTFIQSLTKSPTALDEINEALNKYFDTSFREEDIAERNEQFGWGYNFKATGGKGQARMAGFAGNTNNDSVLYTIGGEKLRESNYNVAEALKAVKDYLVSTGLTEAKAEERINQSKLEQKMNRAALSRAQGGAEALSGIARGLVPQSIIDSVNINRRSTEEMFKRGKELVDNGTINPEEIVNAIAFGEPRVLSPDEVAALVYYKNQLDNRANKAYESINEARAKNDRVQEQKAKDEAKNIEQSILNYEVASIKTAYEQSLAFRLRKLLADASYSLVSMRTKYKALYGTLPEDVSKRFDELDKLLKEKQKAEDEWLKEKEAYEEKLAMLRLNDQYEAERTNPKAISPKVIATLKSWGSIISKPISSIFSKKGKGQARKANDTSDGEVVYRAAVNMVMDYVAEKNDASDKVVNAAIAKAIKAIKASVWYGTLSAEEKIQAEKEFTDSIKDNVVEPFAVGKNGLKIPNSVIKYYVAEQGLKDIDDVAAAILRDYKAQLPDGIEVRDIRDAITQYGITLRPSQEEIAKTIRELKQVGMKRSQIEDLKKGLRPLRSGYIADPKSDTVRNLEKEVKQRLKELGVEDVNPEVYLQSALARIKTALGNQIKDLDKEIKAIEDKIAAGEKVEGFKKSVKKIEYDTEALALKEERDGLKKVREGLLEQAGVNTQVKIDNAIKALEESINEYERRLRDKDFSSFRSEEVLPETPELKAAREKRDALRKEYNEQKNALITPAMKEFNKLRELQDKLDELLQKDAEGFYAAGITTRPQVTESDAVKKLRADIAAMQQRMGMVPSADDKKLDALRKQLEKVLRGESTTGRGKLQGPDMPVISDLKQQIQNVKDNMGITFRQKENAAINAKLEAIKKIDREIKKIETTGQRSPKAEKFNTAATEALNQVVKGKRKALEEVLKQSGIAEQERLEQAKKNLQRSIEELQRRMRERDFSVNRKPPVDFDAEGKRIQREKRKIKDEYDYEFAKAKLAERTKSEVFWDGVWAVYNIPKGLLSGFDMSAPLRQGLPLLMSQLVSLSISDKKAALKNLGFMFQSSWDVFSGMGNSKDFYENWLADIKESDDYLLMKAAGLYIAEDSAKLRAGEELFANNLLHKAPVYERSVTIKGYKVPGLQIASRSERAFNAFINFQRVEAFRQMAEVFKDAGFSEQQNLKDFKALAGVINTFTGRASLGDFEKSAEKLNKFFFSIRLLTSRLQIINPVYYAQLYRESPKAAFYALEKSAKFFAGLTMILGLAAAYLKNDDDDDTDVDLNFRSSGFGTIRLSKYTKVDITAGFAKPISLITRIATGKYVKSTTGELADLKPSERLFELPGQFLLGKASPMFRILSGPLMTTVNKEGDRVSVYGELYDPTDAFPDLLIPLILQDMKKISDKEGAAKTAALLAGTFFGISVSVKSDQYKTKEQEAREVLLGETKETKAEKEKMNIQILRGESELLKKAAKEYVEKMQPYEENEIINTPISNEKKQEYIAQVPDELKLKFVKQKFGDMTSDDVGSRYLPAVPGFTTKELVEAFFITQGGNTYEQIPSSYPEFAVRQIMDHQNEAIRIVSSLSDRVQKEMLEQYDEQALKRQEIAKAFNSLNISIDGEIIDFNTYFPNAAEGEDWYEMYKNYKSQIK